ncbi:MAG: M1 family metallopeptidase, partial [Gammaproteobacteria bacterium]|nr:M1 family metallopeptidase [Gammaproteobacteria bacterium]
MNINKIYATSIILLTSLLAVAACSRDETAPPAATSAAPVPAEPPPGELGDQVSPSHYRLELKVDPREDRFSGTSEIDVSINVATDRIWLHGKRLNVTELYLADAAGRRVDASYEQRLESGVSLVSLAESVGPGNATLYIAWDAPFNDGANAMFKVTRGEDAYAATQFEAIAAREVFPGFDDPGFKVPFDLSLLTTGGDVAITTTPETSAENAGDGWTRHVFATTPKMPTYLLAFAVGPYDVVDYGMIPQNSIRDREVHLRGVAARGLGERMRYALQNTDGILTELEEYFGIPYPYQKLDLIAVPESFGGAMENIGAITYDEYLMLMDADSPVSQRRTYTSVHAHELAHQWFGNLVTPKWWNDIWLNESFATWMAAKAAQGYWPEGEFDRNILKGALDAMSNDSLAAARQIREPVSRNEVIDEAFDGITYQKGGGVLQMLERYIGEDSFRTGIRLHLDRHADGVADAEDFIESIAEGSDRTEIEQAFKSFIEQPGVPLLSGRLDCSDPAQPKLNVTQSRYAPLGSAIDPDTGLWHIPMCVSFTVGGERRTQCELLGEKQQAINLTADSCPTSLHPNADGAGYYRFALDDDGWKELIENLRAMPATEALSLADSLDAAYRKGVVSSPTYLAALTGLLWHDTWDVADAATGYLEAVLGILDPADLPVAEEMLRTVVGPRFSALGEGEDAGSQLLRQGMLRFMIVVAKDEEMRDPLAAQAAARIGLDGDPDPGAAPAGELETILSVGVQDLGEPFFDLLLEHTVASEDPQFRGAATGALARAEDPVLVAKLQAAVMAERFKGTEALGIIFRQMARAATTELTYHWITENQEAIIEMIPDAFRNQVVPALGASFC